MCDGGAERLATPRSLSFIPRTSFTLDRLFYGESSERALFGEFTIGLLERLDLKLGFRWAEDDSRTGEYLPADAFRPLEPGTEPTGDFMPSPA